ncbi:MAG: LysE family transporter [Bacteroidales bacterium]|nr:LysE family transporter [Bacteroidales bacterium]
MPIDFIISAFVLGIVVAIPPGSVTIIACQRALQFGYRNSLYFTFGSCLSDIFYLALVYFGVANFIASNNIYKIILWLVSGAILFFIGGSSIYSIINKKHYSKTINNYQQNRLATFISGIVVTLSNPMTIVGWIVVAGNFYLIWNEKYPGMQNHGILTILIIMLGVLTYFLPLTYIVSRLGRMLKEKIIITLILIGNIFLIVFGGMAFFYAIKSIFIH